MTDHASTDSNLQGSVHVILHTAKKAHKWAS